MAAILGICNLSKCWLQAGAVAGQGDDDGPRVSQRDASQEILLGPPTPTRWRGARSVQEYVPPYYAVALRALRRRKLRGTPPLSHAWVATSATSTL